MYWNTGTTSILLYMINLLEFFCLHGKQQIFFHFNVHNPGITITLLTRNKILYIDFSLSLHYLHTTAILVYQHNSNTDPSAHCILAFTNTYTHSLKQSCSNTRISYQPWFIMIYSIHLFILPFSTTWRHIHTHTLLPYSYTSTSTRFLYTYIELALIFVFFKLPSLVLFY